MDERFRVVVRWAALILLGVGAGGLASWVGVGPFAVLAGVVVAFVGGVFVGATIWATYIRSGRQDDLLGPSLFRAVSVGFLGVGVVVGALSSVGVGIAIAAAAGLVVLLINR
ncbi:MAG: hypothetical protein ACJ77V_03510 [Chloroflexota bacterium]